MKIKNILFLFGFIGISACNPVVDQEIPTIDIDFPTSNDIVTTNEGLRIVATLTDDTGLLQYKITFDGVDAANGIASDSTSSFIIVDGVPNNEKALYLDEVLPLSDTTFNGTYQIVIACIDVEGNESVKDTVQFALRNSIDPEPPIFNVTGPTAGDTLGIGQGFLMGGSVTDETDIIYSEFFLGKADFSDTIRYVSFAFIENGLVDYENNFSWFFQVDSTWDQGSYSVYYAAWDNYSGVDYSIPFHVSY